MNVGLWADCCPEGSGHCSGLVCVLVQRLACLGTRVMLVCVCTGGCLLPRSCCKLQSCLLGDVWRGGNQRYLSLLPDLKLNTAAV